MELAVQSGSEAGKVFQIDRPLMILGRQVGSDIQVNDSQVSRRHLQVEDRNGSLYVTDLASANGSFINGRRLSPNQVELLRVGDSLRVGDTSLTVRGYAPHPSSTEATSIATSYQGANQVAPQPQVAGYPPQQPPMPTQPNYSGGNAGFNPSQPYLNAPNNNSYPVQPFNQPQPSYNPNNPQAGYPYAQVAPPNYNQPLQPVANAVPKKNRAGLIALIAVLVVALLGGVVFGVLNLLNPAKSTATPQAGVIPGANTPTLSNVNVVAFTSGTNSGTVAPLPVANTTVARGSNGSNVPPPSPANPTPTPVPTTVRTSTPKPTTASSSSDGSLVPVKAFGITISLPGNWDNQTDTAKNQLIGVAPDNKTFVELAKSSTFNGATTSDRADKEVANLKSKYTDLTVTKPTSTDSKGRAIVEYEFTESGDTSLTHERMMVFKDSSDDTITYFVFFSTSKDQFVSQDATFQAIASSIDFSS